MTADLETHVKTFARQVGVEDHMTLDQVLLDGMEMSSLGSTDFIAKMTNLELLSMNFCKLPALDTAFPASKTLARLELSDNELTAADLEKLTALKALTELHLNGNKIATVKDLEALKNLKALKILMIIETDLSNNNENYRAELFELLPQVEIIDGFDRDGQEVDLDDDESDEDSLDAEDSDEHSGFDSEDDSEDDEDDDEEEDENDEDDSEDDAEDAAEPASKKPRSE
jgi:hypothetical protein